MLPEQESVGEGFHGPSIAVMLQVLLMVGGLQAACHARPRAEDAIDRGEQEFPSTRGSSEKWYAGKGGDGLIEDVAQEERTVIDGIC